MTTAQALNMGIISLYGYSAKFNDDNDSIDVLECIGGVPIRRKRLEGKHAKDFRHKYNTIFDGTHGIESVNMGQRLMEGYFR